MPNQQLIEYIKQATEQGQSRGQIKSALLGAGWQEGDIEVAFGGGVASKPTNFFIVTSLLVRRRTSILLSFCLAILSLWAVGLVYSIILQLGYGALFFLRHSPKVILLLVLTIALIIGVRSLKKWAIPLLILFLLLMSPYLYAVPVHLGATIYIIVTGNFNLDYNALRVLFQIIFTAIMLFSAIFLLIVAVKYRIQFMGSYINKYLTLGIVSVFIIAYAIIPTLLFLSQIAP